MLTEPTSRDKKAMHRPLTSPFDHIKCKMAVMNHTQQQKIGMRGEEFSRPGQFFLPCHGAV